MWVQDHPEFVQRIKKTFRSRGQKHLAARLSQTERQQDDDSVRGAKHSQKSHQQHFN
jgi:hypothetical protein